MRFFHVGAQSFINERLIGIASRFLCSTFKPLQEIVIQIEADSDLGRAIDLIERRKM